MRLYTNREIFDDLLSRLKSVIGEAETPVPLHIPEFNGNEKELVLDCVETVSSIGSYVNEFERKVAAVCGAKYCVAVVNGTAALEICMKIAGVRAEDEVIIPTLTFVATANAVHRLGAIPHFVDSCEMTLGIDPVALKKYLKKAAIQKSNGLYNRQTGRRISCLIPMHVFGHPVEMNELCSVAEEFCLTVIEDAAEALGSQYRNRPCGSLGLLGAISFNGNKIITTGGGGAIVTSNEELADRARHLSTTAKIPHAWEFMHDEPAYNYRLPNLNAALGVAQISQLDRKLLQKRYLAEKYLGMFDGIKFMKIFSEPKNCLSNYWLNALILGPTAKIQDRNEILKCLIAAGYMVRPVWNLMHTLPFHTDCPRAELKVAENLEARIINLPSSASLSKMHHKTVLNA